MYNYHMLRFTFFLGVLLFININQAQAEVITDFSAEYTVQADATVDVVETINYDFEGADKHGIFRTLEKKHPQAPTEWYKNRYIDIKVLSVTRDGKTEPFIVTDSSAESEIKIGDPNSIITGSHIYKINYELVGALSYGNSGAEFYWNVTGNDWLVPINQATALVRTEPAEILLDNQACYQGYFGSDDSCTNLDKIGQVVMFTASDLQSGEGLTIASELNSSLITLVTTEKISFLPIGFILALLWLLFAGYRVYNFRTEAKTNLPVIAQYEPYEKYLPMYTGVLFDGVLDPRDITAGILFLAEQGFIKIKKTEKKVLLFITVDDYEITLLRPVSQMPTQFLQKVSGLLFSLSDTPPKTVMLSNLASKRVENSSLIRSLNENLKQDLLKSGFNVASWPKFGWYLIFVPVVIFAIFAILETIESAVVLLVFMFIPTIFLIVFTVLARRTRKGYEVLNHLQGFKLFLSVTDKERFNFHNAPEKSPELFMKYLPYAVALGVEEKWAKVFANITIPQPDWYEGGSLHSFSAVALTNDLGAFSNTFSSSSGTSGSSGGGSSGGGGGGGGGGSW